MKFAQLKKSLEEGIAPVYLIEGEESYFRDHAVSDVRDSMRLSNPLLNDARVEGETLKGDRLVSFRDELYQLPFLDERRLVRAYGFYPTEREWESVFKQYVERPCPTTVLLIVNPGKKANAADLKKKKGVTYVDCSKADEETLTRWVFALMRRAMLQPDADAAGLMTRYCNNDAARLRQETEKLKLLLGEGGRVTHAVVEEQVAKDAEYKIYELTQAASRGNFSAFSEILHDLTEKGYDESAALSALISHFKTLSEVAGAKGTDAEIGALLNLKPYAVQKDRELVSRLGRARTQEIYRALYALACDMRCGDRTKRGALFSAVAKIFFG